MYCVVVFVCAVCACVSVENHAEGACGVMYAYVNGWVHLCGVYICVHEDRYAESVYDAMPAYVLICTLMCSLSPTVLGTSLIEAAPHKTASPSQLCSAL